MYVIIGATGNVGSAVAETLLSKGAKVRVIGRDPNRLKLLTDRGAEAAVGSVEDAPFLRDAFAGATGAFTMIPPNLQVDNVAESQDRVGVAITEALAKAKPAVAVGLSSIGAEFESGTGPIQGLGRQEKRLNALEHTRVLNLRPAYFMENFLMSIPVLHHMGILGTPLKKDIPMYLVATRDIGQVAAGRLLHPDFAHGAVLHLLGPSIYTMQQAAAILGSAVGKPDLPYVEFSYEDAEKGMVGAGISPAVAASFIEMYKAMNDRKFLHLTPADENRTPTTLEDFAPTFAAAYRGGK